MDFKSGDVVICLPDFIKGDPHSDAITSFGGAGYKEGRIFIIGNITRNSNVFILWPMDGSSGIYAHAVKKYIDRKVRIDNLNLE